MAGSTNWRLPMYRLTAAFAPCLALLAGASLSFSLPIVSPTASLPILVSRETLVVEG